jgi:hypothetical protein
VYAKCEAIFSDSLPALRNNPSFCRQGDTWYGEGIIIANIANKLGGYAIKTKTETKSTSFFQSPANETTAVRADATRHRSLDGSEKFRSSC